MDSLGKLVTAATSGLTASRKSSDNSVRTVKTTGIEPVISPLCDLVLPRLACWKPTSGPWELTRELREHERLCLERHAAFLDEVVHPMLASEYDMASEAVSRMCASRQRSMRRTDVEAASTVRSLTTFLGREFPLWAIVKGCHGIRAGTIPCGDPGFMPSDDQTRAAIDGLVRPFRERQRTTNALLAAVASETQQKGDFQQQQRLSAFHARDRNHAERVAADLYRRRRYRDLGIDPNNPNPDGSDFHLMNAIEDELKRGDNDRANNPGSGSPNPSDI